MAGQRGNRGNRRTNMTRDAQRAAKDAREKASHDRVERLLSVIINRQQNETYGRTEGLMELEESRMLAMAMGNPGAAVAATVAKCKLMGLMVEKRQEMPPGAPGSLHGPTEEQEDVIMERLRERAGPAVAARFKQLIDHMRDAYNGGQTIDAEATEIDPEDGET